MKIILLFLLFLAVSYSYEKCVCGPSHTFNETSNTCQEFPKDNEEGFIEHCTNYKIGKND